MGLTGNPYLEGNDIGGIESGGTLKFSFAAGAASATQINVTGMTINDKIVSVAKFDTGVPSDETANVTAIVAGGFKLSSVTSSLTLQVVWVKRVLA